jgi:hypothetical protein
MVHNITIQSEKYLGIFEYRKEEKEIVGCGETK